MPASTPTPRRFQLVRDVDVTGVSGTGIVADGVLWPDQTATVRWRGDMPSTVNWDNIAHAERVHGHGGATRFEWLDHDPEADEVQWLRELVHVVYGMAKGEHLGPLPQLVAGHAEEALRLVPESVKAVACIPRSEA
ncbi:hypothetical protein [Actinomadura sp. KC216]|uniref:hypothetical protein n=1 Tax=Actinomadura sp. KC216 TaxID=2530370 RepID=UPI001A9E85EB|nr:hypothetical protein [Actinomadura sp. KC216]